MIDLAREGRQEIPFLGVTSYLYDCDSNFGEDVFVVYFEYDR